MNKSETIGALAEALAKAQAEMSFAKKDSENPFFKSKYSDLASCWEACREPLTKNGLAVIQPTSLSEAGVVVETTLAHSSGEWISSCLLMPLAKRDAQAVGSAITYGRRYALSAMVGLVSDDDDGEAAMSRGKNNGPAPAQMQGQKKTATKPNAQPKQAESQTHLQRLFNFLKGPDGLNLNDAQCKKFIQQTLDREIVSTKELTDTELDIIEIAANDLLLQRKGAA